jgi:DNA-binding transcriptional regulator GbsR (MarR family)
VDALTEAKNLIVRRWGEMGGYWGINRTMAEIHALLFVTRKPLCTDEIMDQLKISRGNASMNLRGLVDWGLIERVHQLGDRKEYFQAHTSVWRMFEIIMRERRRREVEPIVSSLDRAVTTVETGAARLSGVDPADTAAFCERVKDLRNFLANMSKLFELVLLFGPQGMENLADMMENPPPTTDSEPAGRARAKPRRTLARR